jgi:hypothetical protein
MHLERAVLMMARVELAALQGRYDQTTWGRLDGIDTPRGGDIVVDEHGEPIGFGTCGTARCAAGWALYDSPHKVVWEQVGRTLYADVVSDGMEVPEAACEWLGIEPPADSSTHDPDDENFTESDDRWNYEENAPRLFDARNTLEDVYDLLMEWMPDITREQFDGMVMNTIVRLQTEAVENRVSP